MATEKKKKEEEERANRYFNFSGAGFCTLKVVKSCYYYSLFLFRTLEISWSVRTLKRTEGREAYDKEDVMNCDLIFRAYGL